MNSRFSGRSGFGSWFGNVPSGSKKYVRASIGSRSRIGGSITPAIPFAASITTASGRIASTSTNESTRSTYAGQMSCGSTCPPCGSDGHLLAERAVADLEQPRLAADRQRATPHDLHPRVLLRVVRGGDHDPAVERRARRRRSRPSRSRRARGRGRPRPPTRLPPSPRPPSTGRTRACRGRPRSARGSNCST